MVRRSKSYNDITEQASRINRELMRRAERRANGNVQAFYNDRDMVRTAKVSSIADRYQYNISRSKQYNNAGNRAWNRGLDFKAVSDFADNAKVSRGTYMGGGAGRGATAG